MISSIQLPSGVICYLHFASTLNSIFNAKLFADSAIFKFRRNAEVWKFTKSIIQGEFGFKFTGLSYHPGLKI